MEKEIKVLDKGFVRLVSSMGDDSSIVNAARVSYGNGTKTKREDDKLIDYLLRNKHWSPFEMVEIAFHIKLPIFVMRQLVRHRTANLNEVSARYSMMKDEFYIPHINRIKEQSKTNKQCSGEELPLDQQLRALQAIKKISEDSYSVYQGLLDRGVARELARMVLPVNLYTEIYWKMDLRNLFNFISLRDHDHAQEEIREYAKAIYSLVKVIAPAACESFERNIKNN